jgi:hypothetical protein
VIHSKVEFNLPLGAVHCKYCCHLGKLFTQYLKVLVKSSSLNISAFENYSDTPILFLILESKALGI